MSVLLVEPSANEQAAFAGLAGCEVVAAVDLAPVLAAAVVDAVVVASAAPSPITIAQQVHRAHPGAGVVLLTDREGEDGLRRAAGYAPGVPLNLRVVPADDPSLRDEVEHVRLEAAAQRRHRSLLDAVAAHVPSGQQQPLPVLASLGALLDHAPIGVLVTDASGRVLAWNQRAATLLGLPREAVGQPLTDVLPTAQELVTLLGSDHGVAPARTPTRDVTGPGDAALEVSAVGTQLDDGRRVVLLLLVDVTARRDAERGRDRLAGQMELIASASQTLTGTLDVHEALGRLGELVVPALADWVTIQIADGSGLLRLVTVRHHDPALAPVALEMQRRQAYAASAHAPSRVAMRSGKPLLLTRLTEQDLPHYVHDRRLAALFTRLGVSSLIAVPLPGRHGVLGSMVLVNAPDSRQLTDDDASVAAELGRRAGTALDNARLYDQQRQLAQELQRSLLTGPPEPDHGQVVVRYVAAAQEAQVGGDWYDAFVQPTGATVLAIGDVVGHDTRAAAGMAQLRGLLRGIGYTTQAGPAEILARVDDAIRGLLIDTTATAVVARMEQTPQERERGRTRLRWSNAGHPPPVVLHPDGAREILDTGGHADLLLGIDPGTTRRETETVLDRGATVLLYTDGLVERRGQPYHEGVQQLVAVLAEVADATLDELCDMVLRRMLPPEPEDDVALIAVRLHRQDLPRPPDAGPERLPPGLH